MFFDGYQLHKDAQIRTSLLWEYEIKDFDWQAMRDIVVQRVIERGKMEDFYAALNLYGLDSFKSAIKNIPFMNKKDISFVCNVFEIKKNELKCYTHEQLRHQHLNS